MPRLVSLLLFQDNCGLCRRGKFLVPPMTMMLCILSIAGILKLSLGAPAHKAEVSDRNAAATKAAIAASSIYRPGLRNSFADRKLSDKEMNLLLTSLQNKTGFTSLQIDEAGFLSISDAAAISGGSATARALLLGALQGQKSINLQSHNHSPQVAFARLASGIVYTSKATGVSIEVQAIEIDFKDFGYLRGDSRAVDSFDPGLVVLHELCHAVLGLRDPREGINEAGDCENHINRIRRELGLPERQNYIARSRLVVQSSGQATSRLAEIIFARSDEGKSRQWFYLTWEMRLVGGREWR